MILSEGKATRMRKKDARDLLYSEREKKRKRGGTCAGRLKIGRPQRQEGEKKEGLCHPLLDQKKKGGKRGHRQFAERSRGQLLRLRTIERKKARRHTLSPAEKGEKRKRGKGAVGVGHQVLEGVQRFSRRRK